MANTIKVVANKIVFDDSEQSAKDLDGLVKGDNTAHASRHNVGGADAIAFTPTSTDTFTNKRNTKRAYSVADTGTLTPEINTYDMFTISALAQALNIANHSTSTPNAGDCILINITPDATPRALTYGTNYVAYSGVALPSTTVASKKMQMMFIWLPVGKYSIVWGGNEA